MAGYDNPVKSKQPSKKLWSLYYGSQIIERDKPYGVCKAKENELKRNVNYKLKTFTIK